MKRFVVVGLGNFGSSVAESLFSQRHEVIAIDMNEDSVDRVAPYVSRAAVGDAKNIRTLERLGVKGADAAVVSTGDDITASILTTMALHDLGIRDVYVKVISRDHARVMERMGVSETIFPERESALSLGKRMSGVGLLNYVSIGTGFSIQEMGVPSSWNGKTLRALALRQNYGITVVAIHDVLSDKMSFTSDPDTVLKESDALIVAGNGSGLTAISGGNITTGSVSATQLSATAIDGMTITGSTVRTAASGARVVMDSTGIKAYNSGGTEKFSVSASTGLLTATDGTFTGAINASSGSITGALTMGASGSITAGNVAINTSGITGTVTTGWNESVAYKFKSGATTIGGLFAYRDTGYTQVTMSANAKPLTAEPYESGQSGRLTLSSISAGAGTTSLSYVSAGNYNTALTVYTEAYMLISAAAGASVTTSIALVAGSLTFNGNTIWHSGNDGAGSGLDADTLDGYSSASFGRLSAGNTWSSVETFSGGLRIGGDPGGAASTIALSNVTATAAGADAYSYKMNGGTAYANSGWMKIYVGTSVRYVPYWTSI